MKLSNHGTSKQRETLHAPLVSAVRLTGETHAAIFEQEHRGRGERRGRGGRESLLEDRAEGSSRAVRLLVSLSVIIRLLWDTIDEDSIGSMLKATQSTEGSYSFSCI